MHLWVQVDNTAAENKNQLVVRYLGALIDKSVFRSAVLSFMRVGHTHEDIGGSTLLYIILVAGFANTQRGVGETRSHTTVNCK